MPSYFSIVKYVPDPIADEQINVGVVVFEDNKVESRFVTNWDRVSKFGRKNEVGFLQDFADSIAATSAKRQGLFTSSDPDKFTAEFFRSASINWCNSIQVSAPRLSMRRADDLLAEAESRYLSGFAFGRRTSPKSQLATRVFENVRSTLLQAGDARIRLIRRHEVTGQQVTHSFDFGAQGIGFSMAARVIPYDSLSERRGRREIEAAAYAFSDVRRQDDQRRFAAVAPNPAATASWFLEYRKVLGEHNAVVLIEAEVADWARSLAA